MPSSPTQNPAVFIVDDDADLRKSLLSLVEMLGHQALAFSSGAQFSHYYRAEMARMTSWRDRLDLTSNWAITVTAALLSVSLSTPTAHHGVLLFAMLLVLLLLYVEARRYRFFDVYRMRVRQFERHYFGQLFGPGTGGGSEPWLAMLAKDLRHPMFRITFGLADGLLATARMGAEHMHRAPIDAAWLEDIQRFLPAADITVLLDIAPETAVERKASGRDRYERDLGLLARVRESYRRQAARSGWVVINAEQPRDEVGRAVEQAVWPRLARPSAPGRS